MTVDTDRTVEILRKPNFVLRKFAFEKGKRVEFEAFFPPKNLFTKKKKNINSLTIPLILGEKLNQ